MWSGSSGTRTLRTLANEDLGTLATILSRGTVEQIPDDPVPEMVEQLVKLPKTVSQDEIQTVQTMEVPLLQFNKVLSWCRQVHVNRNVQKTMEIHQLQCTDDVVDVPIVLVMQSPLVHVVAETAVIPQLPLGEKIVAIPKVRTVQGTQTSESFTGAGNRDH